MRWQRVLITGASSGLGWALAEELASPGKILFLTGRDGGRLDRIAHIAEQKGARAQVCVADLGRPEGQQRLTELVDRELPDLLIHNAGVGMYGRFADVDCEQSEQVMQVNVMTVLSVTHAWCRALQRASKPGKIVFISSAAAFLPCPGMTVYGASKAWVNSFAEGLRWELRGSGISVLTICPGHFVTNFQRRAAGQPLATPASSAAAGVARDVIRVLDREGVYVPLRWRLLLSLRRFVPDRLLMRYFEANVLRRARHSADHPNS